MLDRNEGREILVNEHRLYKKFLKERGLKRFRHYSKMKLNKISPSQMKNLSVIDHIYKTGDTLSKLSYKYYGDIRYWWVIGWFNKKPIDNLYKVGDTVHIPLPIEEALYYVDKDG
jgi:nucleoid-associated protein YgaU